MVDSWVARPGALVEPAGNFYIMKFIAHAHKRFQGRGY
jgi:hypothetical protein